MMNEQVNEILGSAMGGEEEKSPSLKASSKRASTEVSSSINDVLLSQNPTAALLEAILFASQKPISTKELLTICKSTAQANPKDLSAVGFGKMKTAELTLALAWLQKHYEKTGRSFEVKETAAGWQLVTRSEFAPWVRQLFPENRQPKLSTPALETLAIIAYRQPLTRAEIEAVRGVAVDGVMQTLLDRGLIKIAGRSEVPGHPLLYDTTQHFMHVFGLRNLKELPNAQELRSLPLPKVAENKRAPPLPIAKKTPPPPAVASQAISRDAVVSHEENTNFLSENVNEPLSSSPTMNLEIAETDIEKNPHE